MFLLRKEMTRMSGILMFDSLIYLIVIINNWVASIWTSMPGAIKEVAPGWIVVETENVLLMAHSLGLGTCIVVAPVSDIRDDEKMMELLKVPHGYKIIAPVAIGYPDESPGPRPRLPLEEITYYEEFGRRKE